MPERSEYAPGTPCWVDLVSLDPDAAVEFYTSLFGWEADPLPTDADIDYVMLTQDGREICAVSGTLEPEQGMPNIWTTYFAGDPDDAAEKAENAGGAVGMPPMDVMDAGRMAMIQDPTTAMFGVWQAGEHVGARLVNEPNSLCWNELATNDLDRASSFYSEVFGYDTDDMPMGDDEDSPPYRTLLVGGDVVAGIYEMTEDMSDMPPHWLHYFAVEDTESIVEKAEELGGEVLTGPQDSPFGRMAVLRDPDDGVFAVIALGQGPDAA